MCCFSLADVWCEVVEGLTKNNSYHPGFKVDESAMADMWNVVYVEGGYRLVDVVWASVCEVRVTDPTVTHCEHDGSIVHHINDFYFLTDPDMMITTHLPYDDTWQLLPKPITKTQFLNTVYIQERYYELSLYPTEDTKKHCLLKPKDGHVLVDFGFKDNKHVRLECHLRQLYPKCDNSTQRLADYLMYIRCNEHAGYRWRHPHPGVFEMNIYGRDEKQHKEYQLVCQYTIKCDEAPKDCKKLPAYPDIGWGPGPRLHATGILPSEHIHTIIDIKTGNMSMVFDNYNNKKVKFELQHYKLSDNLLQTSLLYWIDKPLRQINVQLRLPQAGEYRLAMYKKSRLIGVKDTNVCNYLINVERVDDVEIFPLLRGTLGSSALCKQLGVKPLSHKDSFIKTTTSECNIVLSHKIECRMVCELTNNYHDREFVAQRAIVKCLEDGKSETKLNLLNEGQYGVNFFVMHQDAQRLHHVYTYLVEHGQMKQLKRKQINTIFRQPTPATVTTCSSEITITVRLRNPNRTLFAEMTVTDMNVEEDISIEFQGKVGTNKVKIKVCNIDQFATHMLSIFEDVNKGSIRCLAMYEIIREKEAEEVSLSCQSDHILFMYVFILCGLLSLIVVPYY